MSQSHHYPTFSRTTALVSLAQKTEKFGPEAQFVLRNSRPICKRAKKSCLFAECFDFTNIFSKMITIFVNGQVIFDLFNANFA